MQNSRDLPLIVQSDKTLLLEVHSSWFSEVRDAVAPFAELIKSPEHFHTYRLSPLSIWNSAALGFSSQTIKNTLDTWSKYPVPDSIHQFIDDICLRYGMLKLHPSDSPEYLELHCSSERLFQELSHHRGLQQMLIAKEPGVFIVPLVHRGSVKIQLIHIGYPVEDLIPLKQGDFLDVSLRETALSGKPFTLRDYQMEAVTSFLGLGNPSAGLGFGTIVMPCGSGKTIIGMGIMERLRQQTLIITTNTAAVHQWIDELIDKTNLTTDDIGEYTGARKEVKSVTVCTYQILVWRPEKEGPYPHFNIFRSNNWGLIIYDEVHLLPAPVFRITAEIQATMRAGMTATLVREDNREDEVFSLIGPKRCDIPWKELEQKGWIAEAVCTEIRVALPQNLEISYAVASKQEKFRIASENPRKIDILLQILENNPDDQVLVIGQYIKQLQKIAQAVVAPLITGSVPNAKREELYRMFRSGEIKVLVVSKVANFAIDLPDASLAVQVSGTFGSRQEEAQRLGRILRPKQKNAHFYNLVTRYTTEEQFAAHRQHFLTEQGYTYQLEIWDE